MNLKFLKKEELTENDILNLYCLQDEVFFDNDKMNLNSFKEEFKQENRYFVVLKQDDTLIGYIGVINCVDCFEIIGIGVKTEFQHQGFGTILISKIIEEAKRIEINKIFLEVDEKNIKAQNFYKKNGFILTNIRKKYYKDNDAYIFMLNI